MELSISKKFLFVEVAKTASTSVSHALKPHCLPVHRTQYRRFTSNLPIQEKANKVYLRKHDPAWWAQVKLGEEFFSQLYKFGFVRNPYDRLVSAYEFIRQNHRHRRFRELENVTFSDFLDMQTRRHFRPRRDQVWALCDRRGNVLVDRVCRFENLAEEFASLAAHIGIVAELPHRLKTKHLHYSEYYTEEDLRRTKPIVARDLDYFGYEFGE